MELVAHAVRAAGLDREDALFRHGGRAIEPTHVLQPLVVALSLASAARLGGQPTARHIGHSLGELSALAFAGAISFERAIDLAAERGRLMSAAAAKDPGGLFALHPNDWSRARELSAGRATLALDNAPDEIVAGGPEDALAAIARAVEGRRLAARGPWHTPQMTEARDAFRGRLANEALTAPVSPVSSCVDTEPVDTPERAVSCLAEGLVRPVRFRETIARAYASGIRVFVVVGPGAPLRALLRRNLPSDARVLTVESDREVDEAQIALRDTA